MSKLVEKSDFLMQKIVEESKKITKGPSREQIQHHRRECLTATFREAGLEDEANLVATCPNEQVLHFLRLAFSKPVLMLIAMKKLGDFSKIPHCPDEETLWRHFRRAIAATFDHFGDQHQAELAASGSCDEVRELLRTVFEIAQPRYMLFQLLVLRT